MGPLFDSSASALRFAMNIRDKVSQPAVPIMNAMLIANSHKEEAATKPLARRAGPLADMEKMEKRVQAGIILNFVMSLPDEQSCTLIAKYRNPWTICTCSNLCCSGFRKDTDWKRAIDRLQELLQAKADEQRRAGMPGTFKTSPPLMVRLLTKMFDSKSRLSQLDIAENCGVDPRTVAAHGRYIGGFLDDWHKDGLTSLDVILGERGIVGAL